MSEAEWIADQYDYLKRRFSPKLYDDSHKERINEILEETRKSIREKSGNFVKTLGDPGVFSNGNSVELKKIDYFQNMFLGCSDGFVVDDEWNEFMVFSKKNNEFYLFSWETGA